MHYTSNERNFFSLSVGILNSENKHESEEMYKEMYFFNFYFSIIHFSTHNVIRSLKICMHVHNIAAEGIVSQNFIPNLCSCFI